MLRHCRPLQLAGQGKRQPDVLWRVALVHYLCQDAWSRGEEQLRLRLQQRNTRSGATAYISACWFGEPEVLQALDRYYNYDDLMVATKSGWLHGKHLASGACKGMKLVYEAEACM